MTSPYDLSSDLACFDGRAPLFPLPNAVLFPHILLPLHIFEERYRAMVADSLHSNRLIAVAMLEPGWEDAYDSKAPAIHNTVCLGRISSEKKLSDGRYQLLLQGLTRAAVIQEEQTDLPYRVAQLRVCQDVCPPVPVIDRNHRRRELLVGFREMFPCMKIDHYLPQALEPEIPFGVFCDVLASAMQLPPHMTQQILEELDVDLRSDLVLERLRELLRGKRKQPVREFLPNLAATDPFSLRNFDMSQAATPESDACVAQSTEPTNQDGQPPTSPVDLPRIERAVREILAAIGEDPQRSSLVETPARVARMYAELFAGMHVDPARHLERVFEETYDELVLVRDISFNSMCEHHLLPFMGKAHVGYLPNGKITGLSKLRARC